MGYVTGISTFIQTRIRLFWVGDWVRGLGTMGYSQKVHKRGYMKKEFHSHNRTTGIHCWANLTTEQLRNLRSHATFTWVYVASYHPTHARMCAPQFTQNLWTWEVLQKLWQHTSNTLILESLERCGSMPRSPSVQGKQTRILIFENFWLKGTWVHCTKISVCGSIKPSKDSSFLQNVFIIGPFSAHE